MRRTALRVVAHVHASVVSACASTSKLNTKALALRKLKQSSACWSKCKAKKTAQHVRLASLKLPHSLRRTPVASPFTDANVGDAVACGSCRCRDSAVVVVRMAHSSAIPHDSRRQPSPGRGGDASGKEDEGGDVVARRVRPRRATPPRALDFDGGGARAWRVRRARTPGCAATAATVGEAHPVAVTRPPAELALGATTAAVRVVSQTGGAPVLYRGQWPRYCTGAPAPPHPPLTDHSERPSCALGCT